MEENKELIQEEKLNTEDVQLEELMTQIAEQLQEELTPSILINTDKVQNTTLDIKKFKKGVETASELIGIISSLINIGIDKESALEASLNIYINNVNGEFELKKFDLSSIGQL